MTKSAIFRCEASLEIGTGHVMRCLVLADALKKQDWQCYFATSQTSYELISQLKNFERLETQEIWNKPVFCDLFVFDNYDLGENYEKHFRKFCKTILVIDDMANRRHDCDFLLDHNLGTKPKDYQNLVNEDCKILAGTNYCLLREEFLELRPQALKKRSQTKTIKKILVNFGGTDLKNHTENALKMIEESDFIGEIEVVLGFKAVHFERILEFSKSSKNKINIHHQANMAQLILEADMAVAAGGTSTWERCCLGLPTFMIKIADNQDKIFKALKTDDFFEEFYQKISYNYQKYVAEISTYVDGKGAQRVLKNICK